MLNITEEINKIEGEGFHLLAQELLKDRSFYQKYFKHYEPAMRLQNIDLVNEVLYKVMYLKKPVFITDNSQELLSRKNEASQE